MVPSGLLCRTRRQPRALQTSAALTTAVTPRDGHGPVQPPEGAAPGRGAPLTNQTHLGLQSCGCSTCTHTPGRRATACARASGELLCVGQQPGPQNCCCLKNVHAPCSRPWLRGCSTAAHNQAPVPPWRQRHLQADPARGIHSTNTLHRGKGKQEVSGRLCRKTPRALTSTANTRGVGRWGPRHLRQCRPRPTKLHRNCTTEPSPEPDLPPVNEDTSFKDQKR